MRKSAWIIAVSLMAAGILLVTIGLFAVNFDFSKLDTHDYISHTYQLEDEIFAICADIDTADIQFHLSDDKTCRVECEQMTDSTPITAVVRDNKLYITQEDHREWYEHIGFFFRSPKVTVYLPDNYYKLDLQGATGDVNISNELTFSKITVEISTGDIQCDAQVNSDIKLVTDTGDITCQNSTSNSVNLKTSTGRIWAVNLECDELNVLTSTGDIRVKGCSTSTMTAKASTGDVNILDTKHLNLNVKVSTGDVHFENCVGDFLYIDTSTGDVTGTFSKPMIFECESDTGDIDVENSGVGGQCHVTTDTGDIQLSIAPW